MANRAEKIIARDIDDRRLEVAMQLSASKKDNVVSKVLEFNDDKNDKKIALVVDAAGFNSTREQGF